MGRRGARGGGGGGGVGVKTLVSTIEVDESSERTMFYFCLKSAYLNVEISKNTEPKFISVIVYLCLNRCCTKVDCCCIQRVFHHDLERTLSLRDPSCHF